MFTSKEFRTIARNKLRGHWGRSVLVSFLAALLGGLSGGGSGAGAASSGNNLSQTAGSPATDGTALEGAIDQLQALFDQIMGNPVLKGVFIGVLSAGVAISIALFIVGACVELGHNRYYVDLCNNQGPDVGVLFSRFGIFLKAIGLRLYMGLFIFLWTLLLIVPGIIAGYRYAMAPYIMAQDPNIGIREAVERSKTMMQGHKWRLFCLNLSFIGWAFLCVLTLGIGTLWLNPYVAAANAAFYLDASGQGIPTEPQAA